MSESPAFKRVEIKPEGYDAHDPWNSNLVPERKALAETLTRRFMGSNSPFVVSINSGWGTGKSLFLTMWKDWLTYGEGRGENGKNPRPCLYFNAWENDADDPLAGFAQALMASIKEQGGFFQKFSNKALPLLERLRPIACKTVGAMTGSVGESMVDVGWRWIMGENDLRQEFKNSLREYAAIAKDKTGCPLIVMVDELDRCKPTYAVALLERIKHLFDVENVVFVLAIERYQLCKCISAVYGFDDAGSFEYLGKFIDLQLDLPPMDNKSIIKLCIDSGKYPIGCDYPVEFEENGFPSLIEWVGIIISQEKNLSARQIQQILNHISVVSYRNSMNFWIILICTYCLSMFFRFGSVDKSIDSYRKINSIEYANSIIRSIEGDRFNQHINLLDIFFLISRSICDTKDSRRGTSVILSKRITYYVNSDRTLIKMWDMLHKISNDSYYETYQIKDWKKTITNAMNFSDISGLSRRGRPDS